MIFTPPFLVVSALVTACFLIQVLLARVKMDDGRIKRVAAGGSVDE
jgi:hypothetical protein